MSFVFDSLDLWHDDSQRTGPENMAVDEWLQETARRPMLRVYSWSPGWGSVGYFGQLAAARENFPHLTWVRRWTGGGTVDHSEDWTYTVVAPAGSILAETRGAESYRAIHGALLRVLLREGLGVSLSGGELENGATSCFENPVCHDLVDSSYAKVAGAGQRRSRYGLLHQGSVSGKLVSKASFDRAVSLATILSKDFHHFSDLPSAEELARRSRRYADAKWIERR